MSVTSKRFAWRKNKETRNKKRRAHVWDAPLTNYTQVARVAPDFVYFPPLFGFFRYLKKSELGSNTITSLLLRKLLR